MNTLLILGCSATKRPNPEPMAAVERYDGPLYRVLRGWMRRTPVTAWPTVLVLSAKYGLVTGWYSISDYNQRLTFARTLELRPRVAYRIYNSYPGPYDRVYISMGAQYCETLPTSLPWPAQFAQGGIGQRLAGLKAWLELIGGL